MNKGKTATITFFSGLAAGIAAGLYLNSNTGRKHTKELKKRVKTLEKDFGSKIEDARKNVASKFKNTANNVESKVKKTASRDK